MFVKSSIHFTAILRGRRENTAVASNTLVVCRTRGRELLHFSDGNSAVESSRVIVANEVEVEIGFEFG